MKAPAWFEVFRFECRHQLRSPLFFIVSFMFFLLAFASMASESVSVGGPADNLQLNASYSILTSIWVFTILGMFAGVAFAANPVVRDPELKTSELLFSSGLREREFLLGRFLGGTLFAVLAVGAAVLGVLLGTFVPWLDQERIAAFSWSPYWFALWAVVIPNGFIVGALFFSVAAFTRSLVATYAVALALLIAFFVVSANTDQETVGMTALADPFGLIGFRDVTRYWTVFERNTMVPAMSGTLLYSRLIWLSVAAVALILTFARYRFAVGARPSRRRQRKQAAPPTPATGPLDITLDAGWSLTWSQYRSQLWMDVRGILRSVPFYVILAFGMFNMIGASTTFSTDVYGTPLVPVTRIMVDSIAGSYVFITLIIVVFYAGELVHRERRANFAGICDALPHPSGVMVAAKLTALVAVVFMLLMVAVLTGMAIQALNGYFAFELDVYAKALLGTLGWTLYILCVMAIFLQVLIKNRFAGMFLFIVVFLTWGMVEDLGLEHRLFAFDVPYPQLSDMNGMGHFPKIILSVGAYWTAFAALLAIGAHLLWVRGLWPSTRERLAQARARFTRPVALGSATAALLFVVLGSWIFYNTNMLNEYRDIDADEQASADYEKAYKRYELDPLPELETLDVAIDIYPEERALDSVGSATLVNRTGAALDTFPITIEPALAVEGLTIDGAEPQEQDERLGFYRFRFEPAMEPGEKRTMRWRLSWRNPGFENGPGTTRLAANGTFVDSTEVFPVPGYVSGRELQDPSTRREYELPGVIRTPAYDDEHWLKRSMLGLSQRTAFSAVLSTSADQTAIAPGYLEEEWEQDGRRYFRYVMDEPIWPFVSFLSARYAVARDRWNDVELAVFHHPTHDRNVQTMLNASKKSLDYFSRAFSPYQYRQFRILEFPAYASFAQSFPNTIPFSEGIGFIADLSDPRDIDYVFYVTAHEMAHQWWAHQVIGAGVQGSTFIIETLAQYSALMVLEQEYGPRLMRRFLRYELDSYLRDRGGEQLEEQPLKLVENQGYIHYRKGSVAIYALKDAIGEAAVNRALAAFIDRYAFKGAPFPRSGDLIDAFRAEAGPEHQDFITDLFERIVLYDVSVEAVAVEPVDEGYRVRVTVGGKQFEADGTGRETEVPLRALADIALFPEKDGSLGASDLPEPLLIEKHALTSGSQEFEFVVSERPAQVGVDPYVKLIDRFPDNNLKKI